jgi:alkanesulfonate monooxygenase SsuD/methylene tetrahydromethanopterin reductase-like flavin-dependent oxidoreductase (luciferase family)
MVPMSQSDGPDRMPTWEEVRAFATHAEAIGIDSLWVCDHLISGPEGEPPEGIHEGWTLLSALAASTRRVELGPLVMCSSFRNPGLLAKMAVTADLISGGRLIFGLGAGCYDPEYVAFGYPTDHRASRFEEALRIIKPLLHGERVSFNGRFHAMRDAVLLPASDRRIPILIAAKARRMLGLTARYADAWNTAWYGLPDERLQKRNADFDAALEAEDRDPGSIRRTVGVEFVDPRAANTDDRTQTAISSVEQLVAAMGAYEALAFDDLILGLRPPTRRSLDDLAAALEQRGR